MKEFIEHEQGKNRREQPGEGQAGRPGVQPGSGPVIPPDVQLNEPDKQQYGEYVKQVTPTHSLGLQMLKAFVTGGVICCIGQGILNYAGSIGLERTRQAPGAPWRWCWQA